MPFDLGDTVRLAADSTDPGGTLTNATGVTLTITLPDGTTATPAVTNPPAQTGKYSCDYVTTQAGRHSVRWLFTGPGSAYTDVFDVREAVPPLLFSLADAKKHLNIVSTADDDELRGWIESTTRAVEWFVGPVVRRTVTERHTFGCAPVRVLRQIPALSLVSVTAVLTGGVGYQVADLDLDGDTGEVQRKNGGLLTGPLIFTYTAGRTIIPANIRDGGKLILQHLWRTQRGSLRGPVIAGADDYAVTEPIPGLGYAIPNRALELLEPDRLPPGVA
ncbi:head-tail connector protein [Streptomyces sp. NPDC005708]|uniref:head-tail connector protein n=1 Tax=Streptomyces sp. NPDC005708 TaxID=3154564 RepID=UPI00340F84B8